MVKSSFREAKAEWVYENRMSTIRKIRCFTFPCPQSEEGNSSPFQTWSQSKGLESPEVSAERCPQPHHPHSRGPRSCGSRGSTNTLERAPRRSKLDIQFSQPLSQPWRRQKTAIHCSLRMSRPTRTRSNRLWRCSMTLMWPKSTPSYGLIERRRMFSSVLIMALWKLGSSKLSPSG